jgi:uncharacterized membrane protein YbhN (UPF0104 family)
MEAELNNKDRIEEVAVWKKVISLSTRVIVGLFVLYFVISLVEWHNVIAAFRSADTRFIIIGALLLLANIGIRTLKWRIMLLSVKDNPTFTEAFGSVMLGISLGSFTPGEIGEFAGRALHVTDAKRSHLIGLALLDKAQISIITICAGLISLAFLTFNNSLFVLLTSIIIVFLSSIFIMRLYKIAALGHRLNAAFFKKTWLTKIFDGFNLLKPGQLLITVICTLAFHGVLILQMFFIVNGFDKISLTHAFIGTSSMMFVKSLLPISIGDIGIREAGSIYFFSIYGISQAAALNASLILFFINIFIPSAVGAYFIRHQHISTLNFREFWKTK